MIISEKQIELIGLIISKGMAINYSNKIGKEVADLLNAITKQQSEELKEVK